MIESLGSGGAERQLTGLATMLKRKGYVLEVCYYIQLEFYLPLLSENGVSTCYIPGAANKISRVFAICKHIHQVNPDVIISYSSSTSMISCVLKLIGGKYRLIVSERNTTQQLSFRDKIRFSLYRWADVIVPNSFSQGKFIDNNFPNLSSKINVVTNFVDTDLFKPSGAMIAPHFPTRMICVGRLSPQKNLLWFIEAVAYVVEKGYDLHVDWFGQDFGDNYSKMIYETITKFQLENIFCIHSPIPTIQEEYCKADLFCLPSFYEGFPNVLCEAMSCGLPVLCSKVCDNPQIVCEDENGYLFDPHSIDDMASTMIHFLALTQEEKVAMGRRSRELALEMFSEISFVRKYIELL